MAKNIAERLTCKELYDSLVKHGVGYFCGVPDSIVSSFSFFLEANAKQQHFIAANEGNAIGLAIGYHAATAKTSLVYMQNSGLGNAIDPLVSLVDPSVLSVPMVLLISWRGQPGTKDEPQHIKQGAITCDLLKALGIPYVVISRQPDEVVLQIKKATNDTLKFNRPYALLLQKDTLEEYKYDVRSPDNYPLSREEAIECVLDSLDDQDIVVSSIGKISREVYEYRDKKQQSHKKDLLSVGGMGHASSIAQGIAQQKPTRKVYCLDGDGSVLMHMGSLATIGSISLKNFHHIVFNNGLHDSVGGQPTAGFDIDLPKVAKACGYSYVVSAHKPDAIRKVLVATKKINGPVMIEIRVHSGARADLVRPSTSPSRNKESFMAFLDES
jgi:phosphonopyruvate decarboxylase